MIEEKGLLAALERSVADVLGHRFSTYKARNGREVGIQGDDGEKVWLVHSDQIFEFEAAFEAWNTRPVAPASAVEALREALNCVDGDWQWLCDQLEQYPVRVHPDRTTSDRYLRESAATIIRAALTAQAHPAGDDGEEAPWHGERPEKICEAIAEYWSEWEDERACGTLLPEELAADGGEFATGLFDRLADLATHPRPDEAEAQSGEGVFQQRVQPWMMECFGAEISSDMLERADRFTEEALELSQTMPGFTAARAHALVDYVFGRAVGEREQEVGGVMVTLAALCLASGLDMDAAGEIELGRILQPEIVRKIRAKQAAKPTGSALPIAHPAPASDAGEWRPIETAPKDGTAILALLTDSDLPHTIRFRDGQWLVAWDGFDLTSNSDRPEYWMPLRNRPGTSQDQGERA